MLRPLILSLFLAPPVAADTFVSDAFGILPSDAVSTDRADWAGLRDGDGRELVQPQAAGAVLIFVGPKALVAGKDDGHAVSISLDHHGNLVQGGRAVFHLQSNGRHTSDVRDGIADVLFLPDPKAGTFAAGASVGGVQSPRTLYRVTADLDSVQPDITTGHTVTPESVSTLETGDLFDQFGNPVEDGVGATAIISHADGSFTVLSAPVQQARAQTAIIGRDMAVAGQAALNIGTATASANFDFAARRGSGVANIAVWKIDGIDALGVRLGPVATADGHLLTDGSKVSLELEDATGASVSAEGWVQDGHFQTMVPWSGDTSLVHVSFVTRLGEMARGVSIQKTPPQPVRGAE